MRVTEEDGNEPCCANLLENHDTDPAPLANQILDMSEHSPAPSKGGFENGWKLGCVLFELFGVNRTTPLQDHGPLQINPLSSMMGGIPVAQEKLESTNSHYMSEGRVVVGFRISNTKGERYEEANMGH